MFKNKSILVTGGTGSFGHKFVEKILRDFEPRRVIVFSRDELKQYDMERKFKDSRMRFFIGDVRDKDRLDAAMKGVDFVVHAAALKQVPAAEYNPMECIKTNILGGQNVIDAAISQNVEKVIALSTDKAANPINLYGATKLASDKLFVAANNLSGGGRTRFSVVRYGNVAGSRGSVIDLFKEIKASGKKEYPVTDPRMTRFWITKDQGVEFVLKSFQRMQGGELFVPKIPSINVVDLVKAMDMDAEIRVIGIRPGEKLHEIMCPEESSRQTIEYLDHYVIVPAIKFFDENLDYKKNKLGETGVEVQNGFEYSSQTNPDFLGVDQLRKLYEVIQ
jgi:UDP-N-acetylglucosamine 4,6-dehydratase